MNQFKVVGQEKITSNIERILNIFVASQSKVRPHFILTGPSGSGKTMLIQSLAKQHGLNYMEINAAALTKEGTSGNSLSKALSPLLNYKSTQTICFVDEFDKLFISGNSNSELAHESTNGVQNEFLKVLESQEASVFGDYGKYINVSVKDVIFIFAGAFNGEENITIDRLRTLGIKTEFLGRVGLVYNTTKLSLDNLFTILENSQLLETYLSLYEGVDKEKVIYELKAHLQKNFEKNTLGARMINTMINQYFINGGKLEVEEVEKITFQKKLKLEDK